MTGIAEHTRHYPAIDGLRAIAISLVILEHFGGQLPKYFCAGYYGVDLFFVISGYLITGILLRSDGGFATAFRTFIGRRILRIFPLYYFAIFVFWLFAFGSTRDDVGWLLTYTWNYPAALRKGDNWLFYLWSLSVEEQFYIFWPLVVLTLRGRAAMLMSLTLLIVLVSYCQLMYDIIPAISPWNYTGLINRMGSLGLGSLAAVAITTRRVPAAVLQNAAIELVILLMLVWALVFSSVLRAPILGVCSAVLVIKASVGSFRLPGLQRLLEHRVMTSIGRVSYGMYVYHWPLGLLVCYLVIDPLWLSADFSKLGPFEKLRWHSWIVKLPVCYLSALGVACVSWRWFESPILRLKDRWFPLSYTNAK